MCCMKEKKLNYLYIQVNVISNTLAFSVSYDTKNVVSGVIFFYNLTFIHLFFKIFLKYWPSVKYSRYTFQEANAQGLKG